MLSENCGIKVNFLAEPEVQKKFIDHVVWNYIQSGNLNEIP